MPHKQEQQLALGKREEPNRGIGIANCPEINKIAEESTNRQSLSPLPRSRRLAEVACQQIRRPVTLNQFQVADDCFDAELVILRQFLPRHQQTHTSLACRRLDKQRRITSRRPALDHAGFVHPIAG
jgi:hypothetical protein